MVIKFADSPARDASTELITIRIDLGKDICLGVNVRPIGAHLDCAKTVVLEWNKLSPIYADGNNKRNNAGVWNKVVYKNLNTPRWH